MPGTRGLTLGKTFGSSSSHRVPFTLTPLAGREHMSFGTGLVSDVLDDNATILTIMYEIKKMWYIATPQ
ncbi:hypothetical protein CHS0354_018942 [Potamilus streckersoni]|uniref:Uncharacterized protein n=1 Tax=Potamilus streckersoni TaxID=2493646 RepID=A0AAE0T6T9_9BIVA|nr:hypothetical protein CHS0354_018942 [Potamilus streckersoni]